MAAIAGSRPGSGNPAIALLRAFEVAGGALQPRSRDADLREHEQRVRVTDGGLRRASQTLAAQRLALGLVETSRRGARQRKPEVRQRRHPGIRLESLAREADRLTSPRLRALGSPLLGVDQGEQPEASDVAVGDVRRVGPLDGLHRDPPRLVELAGEEQRLREAREDADAQDVRARASGRDRATSVLDGRAHVAALDPARTGDFHDRLDVRRPQLRPLPPRTLRHREQPLNLDLRAREQRRGYRPACRQRRVLEQQLGGKPAHPAKKLRQPPAPDELAVVLDEQLGHRLGVPSGGGVLDRVLDETLLTAPSRRAAAQRSRVLAPELELQKLAEQMVIAIPLLACVQGDQEHVRARELRQHRSRVLAAEDRVAQLGREPLPAPRCAPGSPWSGARARVRTSSVR